MGMSRGILKILGRATWEGEVTNALYSLWAQVDSLYYVTEDGDDERSQSGARK